MKLVVLVIAFTIVVGCASVAGCASRPTPPSSVPEDALNPAATPHTLEQTICVPAYEASVQAPSSWTESRKIQMMQRSGVEAAMAASYELDQVIPVGLGGHPTHAVNLKLQEVEGTYGAKRKNALERQLRLLVCEGKLGLREAQAEIYKDWLKAYPRYMTMVPSL